MTAFTVDVIGMPVPQGSMVSNGFKKGLRYSNDEQLKSWRNQVISELAKAKPDGWDKSGAVSVSAVFRLLRPQGHYGTGRNAGVLKASAPEFHTVKPDLDKLCRSCGDSIEAAGLCRDQQIVAWHVAKRYCIDDEPPGALITIINFTHDDQTA
tara:strand:- start:391 stop:849 length:459 start_codon:yes stop_codon:yes gene_type:complete